MENARKPKKRVREKPSSRKRKSEKCDEAETNKGSKQQSLVKLFAAQRRKLELVLPEDDSDHFCEIVEVTDVVNFTKDQVKQITESVNVKQDSKLNSLEENVSEEIEDTSLKEFLDEDDSLFSNIAEENSSQLDSQQSTSISYSPYYVENFKKVIQSVFYDSFFSYLFDDSDKSAVDLYLNKLTLSEQKLYSRVYLRKYRWLRLNQLLYNDIQDNISNVACSLVSIGMFVDASSLTDLAEALRCLNAGEIKQLAKSLQLNPSLTRAELIVTIENHSRKNSIASFFSQNNPTAIGGAVLNKVKQQLGQCYRLQDSVRSCFVRIMMLASLSNTISDDDLSGQQQIFQMLSTSIGLTTFPKYVICRKSKVFCDREALIKYGEVLECESKLWQKCENKKYEDALIIYKKAKQEFSSCLHDNHDHITSLPSHLRVFTPGAAYVRILNRGVSILQFLKMFNEAKVQLKELLDQTTFHLDYRGRWFNRLTLNLDFHLKQPLEALMYIVEALSDPNVKIGHRLDILLRGKKILSSKTKKMKEFVLKEKIEEDEMNFLQDVPHVTISGHQLPSTVPSGGSVWVFGKEDFTVVAGVEQLALEYYSVNGYPQGIHGEGSTLTTMFNLMCWDIVFIDGVPDAFHDNFQTAPLDLRSDNFYLEREAMFQERFKLLRESSLSELEEMIECVWQENHGVLCSGLNWELFRDLEHVKGFVKSCGGHLLAGIFERMSKLMRCVVGGVPDLVVWNSDLNKIKFVEVKGPGDKLSSKQILWLDFLVSLGVDAEVCHVKAESSKKLKT